MFEAKMRVDLNPPFSAHQLIKKKEIRTNKSTITVENYFVSDRRIDGAREFIQIVITS
jgi:hypothetical protein